MAKKPFTKRLTGELAARGVKDPAATATSLRRDSDRRVTVLAPHGQKRAANLAEVQAYRNAK